MNTTAARVSPVRRVLRRGKHAAWLLGRRLNSAAAHLPLLAAKERVYDDAFYAHADDVHRPMYERLGDALYRHLAPSSAVDVGCGTGFLLAELADRGAEVRGVEGSRHAIERSRIGDRIVRANLERGVPDLGRFDVAICTEVAEHLPERSAAPLVEGLARMSDTIVFTAATPGQGGTHHVNEQPHSFWIDLFAAQGLVRSPLTEALRDEIRDIAEPEWMRENLIVFQRNA